MFIDILYIFDSTVIRRINDILFYLHYYLMYFIGKLLFLFLDRHLKGVLNPNFRPFSFELKKI